MADCATLLRDHVTLTCRSVDRIFLQAYVPKLQSVGGVCQFLYWQKGFGIPSSAAFGKIGDAYVAEVYRWAKANAIPVRRFAKLKRVNPVRFEAQLLACPLNSALRHPGGPAIVLVLQCVSPSGRHSSVSVTICSIVASGIEGLRPRPFRTCPNLTRPSSPNRLCQFTTVPRDTDRLAAIVAFGTPSAAINKALARTTSRCAPDCDRANDSNTARCPSVIANAGTGLLMPVIIPIY